MEDNIIERNEKDMKKKYKRSFRLFFVWQENKETKWLQKMAQNGYQLKNVFAGIYTFQKEEPKDMIYYLDFRSIKKKDVEEYLDFFKDAGWKYICKRGNWFYFTSSANNKYSEVYTDNQSRMGKYRLMLTMHVIFIVLLSNSLRIVSNRIAGNESVLLEILWFIVFLIFLSVVYSTIRLIGLITKLIRSTKE